MKNYRKEVNILINLVRATYLFLILHLFLLTSLLTFGQTEE